MSAGLLAPVVVVGTGCDEDPPPPEEENRPPVAVGFILDDIVLVGESRHVDVAEYFREARLA